MAFVQQGHFDGKAVEASARGPADRSQFRRMLMLDLRARGWEYGDLIWLFRLTRRTIDRELEKIDPAIRDRHLDFVAK